MDNGIYIALSRQMALVRDMAITTNNIANANTTGYQATKSVFASYMSHDINSGSKNDMAFTADSSQYRSTQPGSMRTTGGNLDVALNGAGYFTLETPLGMRYTRAGNFQLDSEGTIVSVDGYPVLDNTGQRITIPQNAKSIEIGSAGNLTVNGEDVGSIGVVLFDNPQLLQETSAGLFKSDAEGTISYGNEENVHMVQGMLEGSNVQPVLEMTHMIDVSRSAANTAKYIEVLYDLQRKTANAWAQQG